MQTIWSLYHQCNNISYNTLFIVKRDGITVAKGTIKELELDIITEEIYNYTINKDGTFTIYLV